MLKNTLVNWSGRKVIIIVTIATVLVGVVLIFGYLNGLRIVRANAVKQQLNTSQKSQVLMHFLDMIKIGDSVNVFNGIDVKARTHDNTIVFRIPYYENSNSLLGSTNQKGKVYIFTTNNNTILNINKGGYATHVDSFSSTSCSVAKIMETIMIGLQMRCVVCDNPSKTILLQRP